MENNKKYCVWCGTAYEGEVTVCSKCSKNPSPKENMLMDYLIDHTKEKIKSKAKNTLYDAVKNWALSHLYGIVLGVTIVTTVVTVSAANVERHIKNVDSRPGQTVMNNDNSAIIPTDEPYRPTDEDKAEFTRIINTVYSPALENCGGEITNEIKSLWVPESISPNQVHHAFKDRWGDDLYHNMHTLTKCEIEFEGQVYGDVSTTTAKKLQAEGYPVVFIDIDMTLHAEDGDIFYPHYYVTMVKINNKWLILEELNTHSRWSEVKDIWIDN